VILSWLLGALWLGVLWVWLGLHPSLHSDALYLYDLLQSLQAGGHLSTWDLPPAPSLWPDLGLLGLCKAIAHDPLSTQRAYGLAMGAWLWLELSRLLRRLFDLPPAGARAWAAAGLLCALMFAPAGTGLMDWVVPGHHGAAFCIALYVWAWALKQREQPDAWMNSLVKGLGLGLLAASDAALWPWAFLPFACLALRLRRPAMLRLAGLAAAAALGAWLSGLWLQHSGARVASVRWAFILQRDGAAWRSVLAQLSAWLAQHWELGVLSLASLLLWAWPRAQRGSGPRVLLLGWALAALASLVLASLLGSINGRYLYLLLWLPPLFLPFLLAERWPALEGPSLLAPALAGLLWLMAPAHRSLPPKPAQVVQVEALEQALKVRGLKYGWADYWMARPLRLLGQDGVLCVPMISADGQVTPYAWIGDRSLLDQGAALERPQFVVLNGLDEGAVRARLGAPQVRMEFEGLTLFITAPVKPGAKGQR
jgi:hypothetical protein